MIDAEAAFRAAGLGALVDAYREPGPPPSGAGPDDGIPVVVRAPEFDDERPDKPRLLGATFKKGVMRLRVAKPRRGWDAIFRVNGRSYVRANGIAYPAGAQVEVRVGVDRRQVGRSV